MTRSSKVAALAIVTVLALLLYPRPAPRPGPESTSPASTGGGSSASQDRAAEPAGVSGPLSGLAGSPGKTAGPLGIDTLASGAPTPHPSGGIGTAASYCKPGYCDTPRVVVSKGTGDTLRGSATWYAWHPGEAAAGPGLRAWLGADWRGKVVTVIAPGCTCRPVAVRLTDWCLCRDDRIVDLDRASFAALADPSRGIIPVLILEGDWTQ